MISRVQVFKKSKILTLNIMKRQLLKKKMRKMETVFTLCQNITNSNHNPNRQNSFIHYSTVVRLECLYAVKTLEIESRRLLEIEKKFLTNS